MCVYLGHENSRFVGRFVESKLLIGSETRLYCKGQIVSQLLLCYTQYSLMLKLVFSMEVEN